MIPPAPGRPRERKRDGRIQEAEIARTAGNVLTTHGAAPGYLDLPNYLVPFGSPLFDAYSPLDGQWETYPWSTDQRGFNRPQTNVTLGSTEQ